MTRHFAPSTCSACLSTRHYKCRGCACSICGKVTVKKPSATRPRATRIRKAKPVPQIPTLDPRARRVVEIMVANGASLGECAWAFRVPVEAVDRLLLQAA